MSTSTIRVLHIEDDRIQHGLIALHLLAMKEYQFDIHSVVSEDDALDTWGRENFDLVLLDYQLTQGNGLSCLVRLRKIDPIVPIITLSATATPEIAAELIEAGADDYLSKQGMNGEALAQSVRNVLARARAFRGRFSNPNRERLVAAN